MTFGSETSERRWLCEAGFAVSRDGNAVKVAPRRLSGECVNRRRCARNHILLRNVPGSRHGQHIAVRLETALRQRRQRLSRSQRHDERLVLHAAQDGFEEHELLIAGPAHDRCSGVAGAADRASGANQFLLAAVGWVCHERLGAAVSPVRDPSHQPLTIRRHCHQVNDGFRNDFLAERHVLVRAVDVLGLAIPGQEEDITVATE